MPTKTVEADGTPDYNWDECDADDCTDDAVCGLQYHLLDEDGKIMGNGHAMYCAYHCAVNERNIRSSTDYQLDRITVFPEYFETWEPTRRYQTYHINPEREIEILQKYLDAQEADGHPALESRRIAIEAALKILRKKDDMYGVVQEWEEPWKEPDGPSPSLR